tara:strand:- start:428 stop:532 length:105 start_codon:yes stop_codon:yes gene_type:complete
MDTHRECAMDFAGFPVEPDDEKGTPVESGIATHA